MEPSLDSAITYVESGTGFSEYTKDISGLKIPYSDAADKNRADQLEQTIRILQNYINQGSAKRPLSIAVFGPPGSGKSKFVEEIAKKMANCRKLKTVNLTQISEPGALAEAFFKYLSPPDPSTPAQDSAGTPIFFFDEFDAALNGVPLGWLYWFLGPMQEGELSAQSNVPKFEKAVFIFAGGTAESLEEFDRRAQIDLNIYRARKVPDFVSRLRGAIEIGGINALGNARIVPRALALQRSLIGRAADFSRDEIGRLLTNGHFVHGVRSLEILLESKRAGGGFDLPDVVQRQHLSRGVLDGKLIGISAGLNEGDSGSMFSMLTTQLLQNGASLAYGGAFTDGGTLDLVAEAARQAPPELGLTPGESSPPRVFNYLGLPASLGAAEAEGVKLKALETLDSSELDALGAPADQFFPALPEENADYDPRRHAAWAISLFRLRVRLIQDLSALVVLGGKDDGLSWGRFPGIAEEVMIAIALRKPVYVLGGAGGAAHATGRLLGLGATTPDPRGCLVPSAKPQLAHALKPYEDCFQIPGEPDSPIDLKDLQAFLYHRGVTTAAWPRNGLTLAENRELFDCDIKDGSSKVESAVDVIVKGLSRVDWKA